MTLKLHTGNWKTYFLSALLLVGLIVGIIYIRTPQELRKKAALSGATLSLKPANMTAKTGNTFNVGVVLNAGPDSVTGAELHLAYDPAKLEILGFEPGNILQTTGATPTTFMGGAITITLIAQPNAYFRGSDIIGTLKVKSLTDNPARITFTQETAIAAIEKQSNTLVSSTGVTINGSTATDTVRPTCVPIPSCAYNPDGTGAVCKIGAAPEAGGVWCPQPTPATSCEGAGDGAPCQRCQPCPTGRICPMICRNETGTCQSGQCTGPTITRTPTPTPPVGCYYQQVQCIQAPCDPVLICRTPTPTVSRTPTPTCIPRPACLDATPACRIAELPNFCPRKTPTPTPRISRTPTPTPRISRTPTPTPGGNQQTMEFRVKLAGVTADQANGAKITVKLYPRNGAPMQLSTPLSLTHVGSGVYKATAIIQNPFAAGTQFRIKIKGEKHIAIEFCRQVGQTGPCSDTEYITVPNPTPLTYGFDLTGIALPPGDLAAQDGRVDRTDFTKMTGLMSKLCTALSTQDKLVGDLDYSGCINVRDVFLMLQTLETRYDE